MNLKHIRLSALLLAALSLAALASAGVPQAINYQGYLKNTDNSPVNTQVNVIFRLYSTTSGAGALWSGPPQSVTPQNGVYSTQIAPGNLPFDRQYWLGVTAGDDQEMRPLQPLSSVPYALRAAVADNISVSPGQYKYTVSGDATTSYNSSLKCACDVSSGIDCPTTHYSAVDVGPVCYDEYISGGYDDYDLGWIDIYSATPYARSSYSPLLAVGPYGGIGINTGTPMYDLDVSGTVRATKLIGDGSGLTNVTASHVAATGITGVIGLTQGGTGTTSQPSAAGQYLRSTGIDRWGVSAIQAADLPKVYVDLTSDQTIAGKKSFSDQVTLGNGVKFPDNSVLTTAKMDCMGRYEDNGDGTVSDCRSGLIWLKNANCNDATYWQNAKTWTAALKDGLCGLTDGSAAGDWRLPTKAELMAMVASGKKQGFRDPALTNSTGTAKWSEGDPFTNVIYRPYWSSSPHAIATNNAWRVRMGDGIADYEIFNIDFTYVWPVRSGQ